MEPVKIVKVYETKVWIENTIWGARAVMLQHQGCEAFEYAVFNYDYKYTSNAGTWAAAVALAKSLGAEEPIEQRHRGFPPQPTAEQLREQIAGMQSMLDSMEGTSL